MTLLELDNTLAGKPFFFSAMHDYTLQKDHISMLGIYEDDMVILRTMIPEQWAFIEKRRNQENDFLRIDIIRNK